VRGRISHRANEPGASKPGGESARHRRRISQEANKPGANEPGVNKPGGKLAKG